MKDHASHAVERVERAIAYMRAGKMVILTDDEDRENEGDLCVAAEKVTPAAVNFMAKFGRGLVCLSLTEEKVRQLRLPLMVDDNANSSSFGTAFTVSIEARQGVTTGISAKDRAHTILTAVRDDCRPEDLARPGHVFPLRARKGGVLVRAGQTEGSVDLARLAGLKPAGVICEVMNDDGTMARMPQLEVLSKEHDLPIVSVADLISYRMMKDTLVRRGAEAPLPTQYGEFRAVAYENDVDHAHHVALVKGRWREGEAVLVRVHSKCLTGDVFGSQRCDCGEQLERALAIANQAPHPNAARLFMDYWLSRDAMKLLADKVGEYVLAPGVFPPIAGIDKVKVIPIRELSGNPSCCPGKPIEPAGGDPEVSVCIFIEEVDPGPG